MSTIDASSGAPARSVGRRPVRRRRAFWMILGVGAVAAVLLVAFRNEVALHGLPDVGHPFDVARDGKVDLPDRSNAYVEYSRASTLLTPSGGGTASNEMDAVLKDGWSKAGDALTGWLEANRPAMDVWRAGTDKPDALYHQPATYRITTLLPVVQKLREFARLAIVEGARLEAEGKMEEAWGWYRASLRASRHLGRHGCLIERLVGIACHGITAPRVERWAVDPRVDAKLLRRALDDVLEADAMTPPNSVMYKTEYFMIMNTLDDPNVLSSVPMLVSGGSRPPTLLADPAAWVQQNLGRASAYSLSEPERSRRVIRLAFANWLAHLDEPVRRRAPLAGSRLELFEPAADDPPAAKVLTPREIERWFDSTLYARLLLPAFRSAGTAVDRERSKQATMVMTLADQLYRREHGGQPPESPRDLVGPYLKALPEGFEASDPAEDRPRDGRGRP